MFARVPFLAKSNGYVCTFTPVAGDKLSTQVPAMLVKRPARSNINLITGAVRPPHAGDVNTTNNHYV